jgi:hypothetical protein
LGDARDSRHVPMLLSRWPQSAGCASALHVSSRLSEDAPEQFQRGSRDRVGPVVCEEMSRAVDDVADEVVRLVAVDVEHPWPDPCIGAAQERHGRDRKAPLAVGRGEETAGLSRGG